MRRNYIYDLLCICGRIFEQYECSDCIGKRQHSTYQRYLAGQCDDNCDCFAQTVHEHIDEHICDGKRQHAGYDTGCETILRTGIG